MNSRSVSAQRPKSSAGTGGSGAERSGLPLDFGREDLTSWLKIPCKCSQHGGRGGRSKRASRVTPPAGGPALAQRATLAAAALLEGEAEALTRKAVELALGGDPMALRLCIERILPPCRERTVKFALPPIENAQDVSAAMNGSPRRSPAANNAGRGGEDRDGCQHLRAGDRYNQKERVCCRSAADYGIEQF